MRVNPLLGLLQVESALNILALRLANRAGAGISRNVRTGLFVHLDEGGWRFGEAPVMSLERSQDTADGTVTLGTPLQCARDSSRPGSTTTGIMM